MLMVYLILKVLKLKVLSFFYYCFIIFLELDTTIGDLQCEIMGKFTI